MSHVDSSERLATPNECAIIGRLVEAGFPGAAELRQKLAVGRVTYIESNGVPALLCEVPDSAPRASVIRQVPVEAEYPVADGVLMYLLLHVVEGRLQSLEIYREDGEPIRHLPSASELVPIVYPPSPS